MIFDNIYKANSLFADKSQACKKVQNYGMLHCLAKRLLKYIVNKEELHLNLLYSS